MCYHLVTSRIEKFHLEIRLKVGFLRMRVRGESAASPICEIQKSQQGRKICKIDFGKQNRAFHFGTLYREVKKSAVVQNL